MRTVTKKEFPNIPNSFFGLENILQLPRVVMLCSLSSSEQNIRVTPDAYKDIGITVRQGSNPKRYLALDVPEDFEFRPFVDGFEIVQNGKVILSVPGSIAFINPWDQAMYEQLLVHRDLKN